jgi:hypothetical protein
MRRVYYNSNMPRYSATDDYPADQILPEDIFHHQVLTHCWIACKDFEAIAIVASTNERNRQ